MEETYQPDIILSHDRCDDGFAAVLAAKKAWPMIEHMFFNYGMDIPPIIDKHILIADFTWPLDKLRELASCNKSVIVLDHHESAQKILEPITVTEEEILQVLNDEVAPPDRTLMAFFDMDRSGAGLVWDFANHLSNRPPLINYVEDNDLWRHQLKHSKAFTLWLRSYPMDFGIWASINNKMDSIGGTQAILEEAASVGRYHQARINELVRDSYVHTFHINGAGRPIPVSNAPHIMSSDVCEGLMEKYGCDMSATYSIMEMEYQGEIRLAKRWSVRARKGSGANAATFCQNFGGGGHPGAAGFLEPI